MKSIFKSLFVFTLFTLVFQSCEDGTIDPGVQNPSISLAAGTDLVSTDATVGIGQVFKVNLTGTKGDNPMKSITIQEAGTKVDLARVSYAGGVSGNPLALSGGNTTAFDLTIQITAHTDISTKLYSFVVADDQGNTTTKSINITTTGNPPVIAEPSVDQMVTVLPNGLFAAVFKVAKGSGKLSKIEVLINDVTATDVSRLFYESLQAPFSTNPLNIPAADQESFNKELIFRAPAQSGTYKYTVKFIDEYGQSSVRNINVGVGTPVSVLEGILLNQSGPSGQGGLDLDTGTSTGTVSSDPNTAKAEIRDEGIINLQNDPTWKQQISGMNGSVVKYIVKGTNGVSESFSFDQVTYNEQIVALFANGVNFTQKSTDGQRDVSNKVNPGDLFVVKNGDKHYLLVVKSIKVTNDDNKDSYTFDVKM